MIYFIIFSIPISMSLLSIGYMFGKRKAIKKISDMETYRIGCYQTDMIVEVKNSFKPRSFNVFLEVKEIAQLKNGKTKVEILDVVTEGYAGSEDVEKRKKTISEFLGTILDTKDITWYENNEARKKKIHNLLKGL